MVNFVENLSNTASDSAGLEVDYLDCSDSAWN